MRSCNWERAVLWCLYGLIAIGVVGTWFHTSDDQAILGKYSFKYFVMACLMSVAGVCALFIARLVLTPQHVVLPSGRLVTVSTRVKLLGVFLLALLAVVVIEVGLTRVKAKERGPRTDLAEFHPFLQNMPVPGDRQKFINRCGFRGEEIDLVKPPHTYRIFALGGSTVFCGEVDFEHSHCRLLEKSLRQTYPNVKIEVQNSGYPWHTSQHSLIKFLTKVQDFDPDLVIVYHGCNDLTRGFSRPYASVGEYQPDYGHFYGPIATMFRTYAAERGRFHLYATDEASMFLSQQWFSDLRGTARSQQFVRKPWTEWKSLPSFTRNMRNLAGNVQSKHIELVVASQPYLLSPASSAQDQGQLTDAESLVRNQYEGPDLPSLINGMDTFNRTSKAVADEFGAVFVDLEKRVPKSKEYFIDGFHYTPKGNAVVAAAFSEAIIAHRLVEKKFSPPQP